MSRVTTSRDPSGPGILLLQHQAYDKQGFDLHMRAALLATRCVGRRDTYPGMGEWEEDPNTRGDVNGANLWDADFNKRTVSGWAFAWPAEINTAPSNNVPTGDSGNAQNQSKRLGKNAMALPKGSGGNADGRYLPKPVLIPFKTGKPGQDPNAANRKAQQQQGAQDPNQADTGGPVLFLGIGGGIGGFGGQGVGLHSSFATFQGVRTNFSGSSFPQFQGVRTNFSQGGTKVGGTFGP